MSKKILPMLVVVLVFLAQPGYADLVHHYTFDDEDATDRVGDLDGTINGAPTFVPGVTGQAGDRAINLNEFGGSSDNVNFDALEFGQTFSITAWLRPSPDEMQPNSIMTIVANTRGGFAGPDGFKWFVNNWNSSPVDGRMILESHDGITGTNDGAPPGTLEQDGEWHHVAITFDRDLVEVNMYHQGENVYTGGFLDFGDDQTWRIGAFEPSGSGWIGAIDEFAIFNNVLTADEVVDIFENGIAPPGGGQLLFAGDSDMDLDFDQLDLVRVQVAGKYLSGRMATWGEGDWNGAPGGSPGNPPPGNGFFDQLDIIAALGPNHYLKGPYAALAGDGDRNDEKTSLVYDPRNGELAVNAPASTQLTSINIDSASGIFTGAAAQNLGGSFDNDSDTNIFKATFGSSFGSLSFGNVAQAGLTKQFVLNDLTAVGSLAGGGALGDVDLIYIPEPSPWLLVGMGMLSLLARRWRRRNR
jgi:hypothetical protein